MSNNFDSVKELHSVNDGVSAVDVDHVQRFNRFYHIDLSAKWVVGPLTKRFIRAQHLWDEMKLWRVFDKLKAAGGGLRSNLVTFEVRLACSWHFGGNCMDVHPSYLLRKIRNDFVVRRRRSESELAHYAATLFGMWNSQP